MKRINSVFKQVKFWVLVFSALLLTLGAGIILDSSPSPASSSGGWVVVDTGQVVCYGNTQPITAPSASGNFYGQDAQYAGTPPSYTNNGDGTITDNNTGLMWQQDPGDKMTYDQGVAGASSSGLAGYSDWRMPTIKELYSLILFSGTDPSITSTDTSSL
ncbi:MAG: DUF1566 domain-containing protein, partial [bacterium]|nr:DUF1566 domain-containing protein [bacterium]